MESRCLVLESELHSPRFGLCCVCGGIMLYSASLHFAAALALQTSIIFSLGHLSRKMP